MQMCRRGISTFFILGLVLIQIKAQDTIKSFDDLINQVNQISLTLKNADINLTQAKREKLAAIYGIVDPTGNLSTSFTNNTKLPITLFPGEVNGGEPGTYVPIKLGIQYVSDQSVYVDLKILNMEGIADYRLSKINYNLVNTNNKLIKKNLYEDIALTYYNIITLQLQKKMINENIKSAETLYLTVAQKYEQGLVKQQDLNDALVNKIKTEKSLNQIDYLLNQQYLTLKVLCDLPEDKAILIAEQIKLTEQEVVPVIEKNELQLLSASLNEKAARSNYRKSIYAQLPRISIFASAINQKYDTESTLFNKELNWIPSNYYGLRISMPIPTSRGLAQISKTKFDYLEARNNEEQSRIKYNQEIKNLENDYNKNLSEYKANKRIFEIRKNSYEKNMVNYKEGIISLSETIISFEEMVNSSFDQISSAVNILLAEEKININNSIK